MLYWQPHFDTLNDIFTKYSIILKQNLKTFQTRAYNFETAPFLTFVNLFCDWPISVLCSHFNRLQMQLKPVWLFRHKVFFNHLLNKCLYSFFETAQPIGYIFYQNTQYLCWRQNWKIIIMSSLFLFTQFLLSVVYMKIVKWWTCILLLGY